MFKDFGKKLKETGQDAVNQAKRVAETANINAKINKRKGDLSKAIADLGKKFYINAGGKVPKGYEAEFALIEDAKLDIKNMKQQIEDLKEGKAEVIQTPDTETAVEVKAKEEPKPAPKAKAPAKPKAETKPAAKPKTAAKPKAETKPASKPKAEAKPAAKPKVAPKPKTAAKPAPKTKTAAKPKVKPATKTEPAVIIPTYTVTQRVCTACNKPLEEGENVCEHCGSINV